MGGESEAGGEVLGFEFREVFEDLFLGHTTGEVFEYVFHRDTHSPDAGLAAALVRVNCDAIMKVHRRKVVGYWVFGEDSFVAQICSRKRIGVGASPPLESVGRRRPQWKLLCDRGRRRPCDSRRGDAPTPKNSSASSTPLRVSRQALSSRVSESVSHPAGLGSRCGGGGREEKAKNLKTEILK